MAEGSNMTNATRNAGFQCAAGMLQNDAMSERGQDPCRPHVMQKWKQ